jgi:hypothetical protein
MARVFSTTSKIARLRRVLRSRPRQPWSNLMDGNDHAIPSLLRALNLPQLSVDLWLFTG